MNRLKLSSSTSQSMSYFLYRFLYVIYSKLYQIVNTCFVIELFRSLYYGFISLICGSYEKLEWKTHWQSPVCRAILKRKHFMSMSKSSLSWALCSFIIALILLFDMYTHCILLLFVNYSQLVWYTEFFTFLFVSFNTCFALMFYSWSVLSKPMPISPLQQKLFGISERDPGFEIKKSSLPSPKTKENLLQFSSFCDTDCSLLSNYSPNSFQSSPSFCLDSTSSSWTYYPSSSTNKYVSTPKSNASDSFTSRKLFSDSVESPYERPIKTSKQLEEFLKAHEGESKRRSASFEESKDIMSNIPSLDNSSMSVLGKCRYQRACRLSNMETTEDDSSEAGCSDILNKLKISDKVLIVWCERLRKWICQTILVKLVTEIDYINNSLSQMGLPEYHIGTVNLFALHQIAVTKFQHLTTLSAVLPYLDMHLNQEYLVKRIKDLAQGGCMGDFKWNSGGSYGEKPWCDDLPTDSAIVIHVLCCYLDAYLPPEPHFPDGKPFSSKYFKKTPEKMTFANDLHYIYQCSINPPHFKVVIGHDIYSLQKGRNNLFYALLIFFYHLKVKECAMLGRLNLGPSGLNIMWVIE